MKSREDYIKDWKEHFILLNKRKPNYSEKMCFEVGWNAREDFEEIHKEKEWTSPVTRCPLDKGNSEAKE